MIDEAKRLSEVFATEVNRLKLSDKVTYALCGPQTVIHPNGPTIGWVVLLTMKHNMLVGQDPIGLAMPIFGVMPPDDVIKQAAKVMLEKLREDRDQANNPEPPPNPGMPTESQLPQGLRGMKLGGLATSRPA